MKIIFCGPAFTEEIALCMAQPSVAAARVIRNMAREFKRNNCRAITLAFLANKVTDQRISALAKRRTARYGDELYILKSRFVIKSLLEYRKKLKGLLKAGDVVLFYNEIYPYYGLAKSVERKGCLPVLLFADYTDVKDEEKLVRKLLAGIAKKEFRKFKKVISLSDFDRGLFHPSVEGLVLRGGIEFRRFRQIKEPEVADKRNVMYAGRLSKAAGIDVFLEAASLTQDRNTEFYISGSGPLEDLVRERAKRDPRIHYLGYLKESAYYPFLQEMHIFVNPRNMAFGENKNNFPSKILDYLATGRAIISTKFSGWQEFDGYIHWYGGTASELAGCIGRLAKQYPDVAADVYKRNRMFARQFDWSIQAKKILEFISN